MKNMKTSSIIKLLISLMLMTVVLTSCGGPKKGESTGDVSSGETSTSTGASKETDTFIYAMTGDPGNFVNVVTSGGRWDLTTLNTVYSPLYITYPDKTTYYLADSIEPSEDGMVYTLKLKSDVLWNDGTPFTADDVVFTFNVLTDKSSGSTAYARLLFGGKPVVAEKVDDTTVTLTLPEYSAAAVDLFSRIFIMPKHIYEGTTDYANSPLHANPVGTGPYILKEYKTGEFLKFEANPNYFGGEAKIKNLVYRIVENASSAKLALQKGEVDALIVLPSDLKDLENDKNLAVNTFSEGRVGYLMANTNTENMKNKNIRKAVFYALNREELNNAGYLSSEYYEPAYSFLPPSNSFYNDNVEKYNQDIEKSKEMLKAESAENIAIKIAYNSADPVGQIQSTLIQQYLENVGMKAEIISMDGTAMTNEMKKPDSTAFDLFLGGYIMGNDPSRYQSLYLSDGSANYHHLTGAGAEKIDELFTKGAIEKDETTRKAIYNELQEVIQDEAIIFPLVDNKKILVARSDLAGLEEADLVSIYTFGDVSKLYYKDSNEE